MAHDVVSNAERRWWDETRLSSLRLARKVRRADGVEISFQSSLLEPVFGKSGARVQNENYNSSGDRVESHEGVCRLRVYEQTNTDQHIKHATRFD
jgi:hypothetical protein